MQMRLFVFSFFSSSSSSFFLSFFFQSCLYIAMSLTRVERMTRYKIDLYIYNTRIVDVFASARLCRKRFSEMSTVDVAKSSIYIMLTGITRLLSASSRRLTIVQKHLCFFRPG